MATADELLAALTNSGETEKVLVIDNDLRTISIPKSITTLGVEADDDVHRLHFQMPRMCGDTDLSTFNIRINYMNAKNEGDIYVVTDKKVLSSSITFSWLVGPNALAYKGNVRFIVCLKESDADGTILREFNTTVASLPVLEGLEVDPSYLEGELHDVLEQLLSLTVAKVAEVEAAGTAQIAKVQQESTKQQENITEHGAQVLATIPADYQTTVKLADEGVRSKADAIIRTVEGKSIEVNDASNDNLRGLKLLGKTVQFTTTGAQLSYVHIQNADFSYLGVTASATADDNILLNGTTTEAIWNRLASAELIAGKTYTLASDPSLILTVWDIVAGSALTTKHSGEKSVTFTAPNTGRYAITLANGAGATFSNTLANIMCNEGKLPLPYEPYTGGIPSPNPDFPQELVSPGDDGSIGVTVTGKNLFGGEALADVLVEKANATKNTEAGTVTFHASDVGSKTLFTSFKPNTQYTVILYGRNTYASGSKATNLRFSYTDGSYENLEFYTVGPDENSYCVFVTNANKTPRALYGVNRALRTILYYNQCGIFEGVLTEADYEPFGSIISASTPTGLPGIPTQSASSVYYTSNFTDANGQHWICDEIDFARGKYIQRVGLYTVTGDETIGSGGNTARVLLPTLPESSYIRGSAIPMLCNRFMQALESKNTVDAANTYLKVGEFTTYYRSDNTTCAIYFKFSEATDIDTATAWFKANETTIAFPLATLIEKDLTAAELAAYAAAKTAKPFTQIFNDSDVEMEASYNADTELYIDNKIAERMPRNSYVAPAIVETKSGEVISVSDSSDDMVRGLKLFGKTNQFMTTGKNLFDKDNFTPMTAYISDGVIISYSSATRTVFYIPCAPNTTYTVSRVAVYANERLGLGWTEDVPKVGSYVNNNKTPTLDATVGSVISRTLTTGATAKYLVCYLGWQSRSEEAATCQIEIGETATAYEPYTGGKVAPNPEYPQELESVGDSGSVGVSVTGKNLYQVDTNVLNQAYLDSDSIHSNNYTTMVYIQCNPNTTYTVSKFKGTRLSVAYCTELPKVGVSVYGFSANHTATSLTITTGNDAKYLVTYVYCNAPGDDTISWDEAKNTIQIEQGSVATAYEPYKTAQTLSVSTPNGLPGKPVASGGNYTDESGQQWICNEIDFARGVYVQRLGVFTSDGTEEWVKDTTNVFGYKKLSSIISQNRGQCSHFTQKWSAASSLSNGEYTLRDAGYVYIKHTGYDTVDAFKAWLAEQYANGTPFTLHYPLATPIETPLTKAQLAAYRNAALHTNYPGTTIFNDANAGQEVTYVADTKNWIKNQLAL